MTRRWIRIREGVIGLEGVPIQVRHNGDKSGATFILTDERGAESGYWTLDCAKREGQRRADELEQMGLV